MNDDTGYLVRRLDRDTFEVSGWTWDHYPKGVYTLSQHRNGYRCDCPTRGKRVCKHVGIVKQFLKTERTRDPMKMISL